MGITGHKTDFRLDKIHRASCDHCGTPMDLSYVCRTCGGHFCHTHKSRHQCLDYPKHRTPVNNPPVYNQPIYIPQQVPVQVPVYPSRPQYHSVNDTFDSLIKLFILCFIVYYALSHGMLDDNLTNVAHEGLKQLINYLNELNHSF